MLFHPSVPPSHGNTYNKGAAAFTFVRVPFQKSRYTVTHRISALSRRGLLETRLSVLDEHGADRWKRVCNTLQIIISICFDDVCDIAPILHLPSGYRESLSSRYRHEYPADHRLSRDAWNSAYVCWRRRNFRDN